MLLPTTPRVNIPCNGQVVDGTIVTPYLQPVPPRGSGFHRYVFSLYTHAHPLQETTPTGMGLSVEGDWLNQRTMSTRQFLSTRPELEPCSFAFFQAQWDNSVHDVYMKSLSELVIAYGCGFVSVEWTTLLGVERQTVSFVLYR